MEIGAVEHLLYVKE